MAVPNPHPSHAFRHAVSAPAARLSLRHQRVRWLRHGLGAVLALAVVAGGGAVQAAPFAYLTVSGSNVPVFDLATNTVVANVALTARPSGGGVAVNRQGTRVYLTSSVERGITVPVLHVIDATTHTRLPPIALNGPSGTSWSGVAVNLAGDRVYVANRNQGYVAVVDPAAGTVVSTIAVGSSPGALLVNPQGTRLYVANTDGTLSVIDTSTHTVLHTLALPGSPSGMTINAQGTRLYVSSSQNNHVQVIDLVGHTVLATVPLSVSPFGVVLSRDGSKLYVSDYTLGNAQLQVLDTATHAVLSTVAVGSRSTGVGISPDGQRVVVSNFISANLSVIDTASDTVLATVPVPNLNGPLTGAFVGGPNSAPVASGVSLTGTAQVGQTLTGGYTYSDAEGSAEAISTYRWLRGDSVIAGATATTYALTDADAGRTIAFCVTPLASTGIAFGSETCSAPSASVAAAVDGNGDGLGDYAQPAVDTLSLLRTPTPSTAGGDTPRTSLTVVAGGVNGSAVDSTATVQTVDQQDAPANRPARLQAPVGQTAITATASAAGATQTLSVFVAADLGVNGYWQQNAAGQWVNLASPTQGGQVVKVGTTQLRLDFVIRDGGAFDADGATDGSVRGTGLIGFFPPSVTLHKPKLPARGLSF